MTTPAADVESAVVRVESALGTPTLKLLDRKSAVVALPVVRVPPSAQIVPSSGFGRGDEQRPGVHVEHLSDEVEVHQLP